MAKSDKGDWFVKTGRSLVHWLDLDLDSVEEILRSSIHDASDQARLDWLDLMYRLQSPHALYHIGEMVPSGDIECTRCGHVRHIYMAQKLPSCPNCGCQEFIYSDQNLH